MEYFRGIISFSIVAATFLVAAGDASAQTVTLDESNGAVFDGILDGFPGIAAQDGQPDFGGNSLGVAFKSGATEERGVAEFPLAPLGNPSAVNVVEANLIFNIDDVLTTFGPGTEFTGFAALEILVYLYGGDGVVDVADYANVARTPHLIDTTVFGPINDTSLAASGPLFFEVDVTTDVREIMTAGASAVGVVWRTMDNPTGTSLDNLGNGALGPPGVNGSMMPLLSIELGGAATPTPSPSDTPQATATATPSRTPTTTPTATPTRTPRVTLPPGLCIGDCDEDGSVSVSELVLGIGMALGRDDRSSCPKLDFDEDGEISIDELLLGVNAALRGC
jgi:hypothetical protein